MSNPVQILHKDLGIHFKQYNGRFYIAHDAKQTHYPEDYEYLMSGDYLNWKYNCSKIHNVQKVSHIFIY